jgi:serine/threonine protein phosphatase 1
MFLTLKKWFAPTPKLATRTIPRGQRVYAVGDVHGRVDLFHDLVDKIEADDAARGAANTTVILLGDLVDRGPDSAGVLDAAIELGTRRRVRTLCGNHEEMFLKSLESDGVLRDFLRRGGRETVLSYPIDEDTYHDLDFEQLRLELHRIVPERHLQVLRGLEDWIVQKSCDGLSMGSASTASASTTDASSPSDATRAIARNNETLSASMRTPRPT